MTIIQNGHSSQGGRYGKFVTQLKIMYCTPSAHVKVVALCNVI